MKKKGLKNRPAKVRRNRVIARLESQLVSKTKTAKQSMTQVPLEEKDVKRINKELTTLKTRL